MAPYVARQLRQSAVAGVTHLTFVTTPAQSIRLAHVLEQGVDAVRVAEIIERLRAQRAAQAVALERRQARLDRCDLGLAVFFGCAAGCPSPEWLWGVVMGARCPVVVRGVTYPSQKAAAAALGVVPSAVSQLLRTQGDLDRLAAGKGGAQPGNRNGFQPVPLRVGCVTFGSRRACAEAIGRDQQWVQRRPDRVRQRIGASSCCTTSWFIKGVWK